MKSTPPRFFIYERVLAGGFALAAALYVLARIIVIPLFHDEASTYLVNARGSFWDSCTILNGNNHVLNSLLINLLTSLWGLQEWVIRLPNLFGLGLYLWGSFRLVQLFFPRRGFLFGFLILIGHPFMLELFSAARGYGLGLGFFMAGIYFFFRRQTARQDAARRRDVLLVSVMFILACLANLTFLYAYAAFLFFLFMQELREVVTSSGSELPARQRFMSRMGIPLLLAEGLFLTYIIPINFLMHVNEFYHGGIQGLWPDTVVSLIEKTLYPLSPIPAEVVVGVQWGIAVSLILSTGIVLVRFGPGQRRVAVSDRYLVCAWGVLMLSAALISGAHWLVGIRYLIGRTAIFFVPLFFVHCLALLNVLARWSNRLVRVFAYLGLAGLAGLAVMNTVRGANLSYFLIAPYDNASRAVIDRIVAAENEAGRLGDEEVVLGTQWPFGPSLSFYRLQRQVTWLKIVDVGRPYNPPCDYFFIFNPNNSSAKGYQLDRPVAGLRKADIDVIWAFDQSGSLLLQMRSAGGAPSCLINKCYPIGRE